MDDLLPFDALLSRLIKLTSRKEDFLTECVAAVLQADSRAAMEWWRFLVASSPSLYKASTIDKVITQCRVGAGSENEDFSEVSTIPVSASANVRRLTLSVKPV
jgi:hypothetical protein